MWRYFLGAFSLTFAVVIAFSVVKSGNPILAILAIFPVIVLLANGIGMMVKSESYGSGFNGRL